MDLIAILKTKIAGIPQGDHSLGLKSVLGHIEAAYKHLLRGQSQEDETAFTDVIYRTNQAFEGSVKEAYRVLAGKDPAHEQPYKIEQYLGDKKILRDRVLSQFTNYRTQWRNKSTHDYNLDFDENEALLAIVSAFAAVLIDQIAERLIQNTAEADSKETETLKFNISDTGTLADQSSLAFQEFVRWNRENSGRQAIETELQVVAGLSGFLSTVMPDAQIVLEPSLIIGDRIARPDLMISRGSEKILVEVKRSLSKSVAERGMLQLEAYLSATESREGILFINPDSNDELVVSEHLVSGNKRVVMIAPAKFTERRIPPDLTD